MKEEDRERLEDAGQFADLFVDILDREISAAEHDLKTRRAPDYGAYLVKFERLQALNAVKNITIQKLKRRDDA